MNGMAASTAMSTAGSTIAPQTSVPPGKYFSSSKRNRKYHSGRAAENGSEGSAGAPSSAPW